MTHFHQLPDFLEVGVVSSGRRRDQPIKNLVIKSLESIIELKKQKKYTIVNSIASMENIICYLKDPSTVRYRCLGGSRVMFVDWFCDVRPCMQLPQVLGNILNHDKR